MHISAVKSLLSALCQLSHQCVTDVVSGLGQASGQKIGSISFSVERMISILVNNLHSKYGMNFHEFFPDSFFLLFSLTFPCFSSLTLANTGLTALLPPHTTVATATTTTAFRCHHCHHSTTTTFAATIATNTTPTLHCHYHHSTTTIAIAATLPPPIYHQYIYV